jgi:hypothetical protein
MKHFHVFAVSMLALGSIVFGIAACGGLDSNELDFLSASGTTTLADGVTPASGLAISAYNWVVSYKDGSTVAYPFTQLGGFVTDGSGNFTFDSASIGLQSGTQQESCVDVCVSYSTGYEDVCTDWESESTDYCSSWSYDDYYDEDYCSSWSTDTTEYCAAWGTESYSYCSAYGQDCSWYYPSRDVSDIAQAYSEITYPVGPSSVVTTQSTYSTTPDMAFSSTQEKGKNTVTTSQLWTQDDQFITALISSPAPVAAKAGQAPRASDEGISAARLAKRLKKIADHNLAKYPTQKKRPATQPKLGRTHAPATMYGADAIESLPAELKAQITQARAACGAIKR